MSHVCMYLNFFLIEIQLNDDNEKLQKQVTTKDGGQDSGSDAELRRLRAENAALQKSLTSMCTKLTQRYDISFFTSLFIFIPRNMSHLKHCGSL